jgi:PLP dependent protein
MTSSSAEALVATRLAAVQQRVADACAQADRSPASVTIIGVTKTHPPALCRAAVASGLVDLAENRVQELAAKQPQVPGARWHLVGRLQRNKVRAVVGQQVLVHSLDRRRLADALSRRAEDVGSMQRVLVQVNVGDDPAKGGCHVDETLDLIAYARELPRLAVEGLMTIPPLPADDEDPCAAAREHFGRLRELRDRARSKFPEVVHLSMGMSADLEAAVAEGATMIRIGTALFGPRANGPWRGQEAAT